jgi:hypothetical protein
MLTGRKYGRRYPLSLRTVLDKIAELLLDAKHRSLQDAAINGDIVASRWQEDWLHLGSRINVRKQKLYRRRRYARVLRDKVVPAIRIADKCCPFAPVVLGDVYVGSDIHSAVSPTK